MLCFIPGHCTTTPPSTFLWHMVVDHFAVHYVSNWSNKPSFFCKNKFCLKICFSQNIQTLTERFLRTQPSKYIWWFDIQVVQFGQRIIYENSNQKHIHWTINSQGTIIKNSSLDTWFQIKINCLNLNVYSEGHESVNFTSFWHAFKICTLLKNDKSQQCRYYTMPMINESCFRNYHKLVGSSSLKKPCIKHPWQLWRKPLFELPYGILQKCTNHIPIYLNRI